LLPAVGYAVAVGCLIWVYRGFDWRSQLPRLAATDWRWVTLAVAGDLAVYCCQGWRWHLLLRPLAPISWLRTIQAVYIGLFANEVLPLRTGEVIRCYLVSRWSRLPFSVVISSAVMERVIDGVWLILGVAVVAQFFTLPRWFVDGSRVLALILVVLAALMTYAILRKSHAHEMVKGSRWAARLWDVVEGVHTMGRRPGLVAVIVLSLAYLALQIVPIWALMRAYGMHLGGWSAAVVLIVLRLGSVPPQAPGNVGSVQLLTILGLKLSGVDRPEATGFATLLWVVVTVPLFIGGFIALLATRMRLGDLRQAAEAQMNESQRS
jgi:uncharacterized protein (TIRG00374 family)